MWQVYPLGNPFFLNDFRPIKNAKQPKENPNFATDLLILQIRK